MDAFRSPSSQSIASIFDVGEGEESSFEHLELSPLSGDESDEDEDLCLADQDEEIEKSKVSEQSATDFRYANRLAAAVAEGSAPACSQKLVCVNPADILPMQMSTGDYEPTVAIVNESNTVNGVAVLDQYPAQTTQPLSTSTQRASIGRRKSVHLVKTEEPEYPDIKPKVNLVPTSTPAAISPRTLCCRKRSHPCATTTFTSATPSRTRADADTTQTSTPPTRKLKKYEWSDKDDPTVRNAITARANRVKKKNEEKALKRSNEQITQNYENLTKTYLQLTQTNQEQAKRIVELIQINHQQSEQILALSQSVANLGNLVGLTFTSVDHTHL